MTDEAPVLDLDAVFNRPTVKLGGQEYELRTREEFSILEWHELFRNDAMAARQIKSAGTSIDAAKKLSKMQKDVAARLFVGPLPGGITDAQCAATIRFWMAEITKAVADEDGKVVPPPKPRNRSTTGASSRGSKPSTAGRRKTGSTSRRTR